MATGGELLRDAPPRWEEGGGFLLLNPRWPPGWRERVLAAEFPDRPDHVWLATSGSGGVLKLVALARPALEAGARAVNDHLGSGPQDLWLNPLPLFHAGGLGIVVRAALSGARWEPCAPWDPKGFVARAAEIGATLTSLVPAQVHDLVRAGLAAPPSLRAAVVGGGALEESWRQAAVELGWPLRPSYGLTEAASQVATAAGSGAGEAAWLPWLPHLEVRTEHGVILLRGPSLLTGWIIFAEDAAPRWEDPKSGGWLRTGDRGEVRGRALRVLGRVDDLVKIRGELIDLAALERALQAQVPSGGVFLRRLPDPRNGTVLHAVAENEAALAEVRQSVDEVFPPFARPATVSVGPIRRTALGKILR
jgi:O-succinylbenzoic acid--CoA ligase